MGKMEVDCGNLQGKVTLRDIIEQLDYEMFTEAGPTYDANSMTLFDLAVFLHILSNGDIDVEFVHWDKGTKVSANGRDLK